MPSEAKTIFALSFTRTDIKQKEEEARTARLEGRARLVEESRKSYEDRVRREEDEIAAREQDVSRRQSSHSLLCCVAQLGPKRIELLRALVKELSYRLPKESTYSMNR